MDSDIRPSIARFRLNMPSFGNSWRNKQKNGINLNNRNKKCRIIFNCAKWSKEHLLRLRIENCSRLPCALEFCSYNFVCTLFSAKIDKGKQQRKRNRFEIIGNLEFKLNVETKYTKYQSHHHVEIQSLSLRYADCAAHVPIFELGIYIFKMEKASSFEVKSLSD